MKSTALAVLLLSTVFFTQALQAKPQNSALSAHVHGVSEMTVAIEKQTLEIELISPAMNLVGFEHAAKTDAEIKAVKQLKGLLANHDSLFELLPAGCSLLEKKLDVGDQHEHEHEHEDHKGHYDIVASYRYSCKQALDSLEFTVNLFDIFQGVHQISVTWITARQQGLAMLSPNDRKIRLRIEE